MEVKREISSHEHPMEVSVTPHPHPLKLEFSLHYEFSCHLCHKSGSNVEWLYRCNLCEFNSHIHCAASSRTKSSTDETLTRSGNSKILAKKTAMTCPHSDLSQQDDKSAMNSIDLAPTPSIQFSDACFSIDLQRSYMGYNCNYEGELQTRDRDCGDHLLDTGDTKEKSPSSTDKQEKKHPEQVKEVTIHDELFTNWGVGCQTQKSLMAMDSSTSKGPIGTSRSINQGGSASKTEKWALWKQLLCCYHPSSKVF